MALRIGIDVGGTFTKAVLLEGGRLRGKWSVTTTHRAPEGVARGIVEVLRRARREAGDREISAICFSTTQATNALLEGDVAPVGIVAMGPARARRLIEARTRLQGFALSPGRNLTVHHTFLDSEGGVDAARAEEAVRDLASRGARVIAATELFGVEHEANEERVARAAAAAGLPSTAGHEMSRLYGLEVRTLTAALNAALLPRMEETAAFVERSVRDEGVPVPLLVLRGDGGMVSIAGMKERPILTALSGPAASLAGGLHWARVTDGIFIDVGGTSTHATVLRGGSPVFRYVKIGRYPTYVPSLDVRVIDVGGGSMVRLRGRRIEGVGPRSAHIAGLGYSCHAPPELLRGAALGRVAPVEGDAPDYAVLQDPAGGRWAVTVTCAANALGIPGPGDHALGDPVSARLALESLGRELGRRPEKVAREILQNAAWKVVQAVRPLLRENGLAPRKVAVAAGGGAAAALASAVGEQLGAESRIVRDADVISAVGVAMAPVCERVEHTLGEDSDVEEIERLRREAVERVVRSGTPREAVGVVVEHHPAHSAVSVTALDMTAPDPGASMGEEEARDRVARVLGIPPREARLLARTGPYWIFAGTESPRGGPVGVIDSLGIARLALRRAAALHGRGAELLDRAEGLLRPGGARFGGPPSPPSAYVVHRGGVSDLSLFAEGSRLRQAIRQELMRAGEETAALILSREKRRDG